MEIARTAGGGLFLSQSTEHTNAKTYKFNKSIAPIDPKIKLHEDSVSYFKFIEDLVEERGEGEGASKSPYQEMVVILFVVSQWELSL